MDIVDQITTAIGCHHCGGDLRDSVSDLFCGPGCQAAWHADRTEPLTTYREPDDLPCHVFNQHERSSPETTPRRPEYVDVGPDLCRFHQPFRREFRFVRPVALDELLWSAPVAEYPPPTAVATTALAISVTGRENFLTDQITIRIECDGEHAEVTIARDACTFRPNAFYDRLLHLVAAGQCSLQEALYEAIAETCRPDHRPPVLPDTRREPARSDGWQPGGMMPQRRMTDDDQPAVLGWDPASTHAVLVHGGRVYAGPPMISPEQAHRLANEIQNNIRSFAVQAAEAFAVLGRTVGPAIQRFAETATSHGPQVTHDPAPSLAEHMQRALDARRHRNTGPQNQQRAPRQINPRNHR